MTVAAGHILLSIVVLGRSTFAQSLHCPARLLYWPALRQQLQLGDIPYVTPFERLNSVLISNTHRPL